jgi:hypothetical protein
MHGAPSPSPKLLAQPKSSPVDSAARFLHRPYDACEPTALSNDLEKTLLIIANATIRSLDLEPDKPAAWTHQTNKIRTPNGQTKAHLCAESVL